MSQNVVYLIQFPNDKIYIGITTKGLDHRIAEHKRHAYLKKYKVQKAIVKYGFENCKFTVLYVAKNIQELKEKEKEFIEKFNSFINGYNMTLGGDGAFGHKHSEKTKAIIKEKREFQIVSTSHLKLYQGLNKKEIIDNHNNIFKSLTEAAKFYNMSTANISLCIKQKRANKDGICFKYNNDNIKCEQYNKKWIHPNTKRIIDNNGIIYQSFNDAARKNKIGTTRLKSLINKKQGFYYV